MQIAKWMLKAAVAGGTAAACCAAYAEGLTPSSDALLWGRWHARLAVGGTPPTWHTGFERDERPGLKVGTFSLMGDYYFSRSAPAARGFASGFRATSGLVVGPRTALWASRPSATALGSAFSVDRRLFDAAAGLPGSDADNGTVPYLGVGYSGLSLRGGWSVSADLGLMAQSPGSVKLGRTLGSTQGLDDLLRDLRLSPVIQLGVSYSF